MTNKIYRGGTQELREAMAPSFLNGDFNEWEYRYRYSTGAVGSWVDMDIDGLSRVIKDHYEFRTKLRTITIGDMEVPEPLREIPSVGETVAFVDLEHDCLFSWNTWNNSTLDIRMLKQGLFHETSEAAIQHAKALIKISGGKVD